MHFKVTSLNYKDVWELELIESIWCAAPNSSMFTFLELISFAFQGHLLELLGRLGAGVNRKVFAPQGQIIPCFN